MQPTAPETPRTPEPRRRRRTRVGFVIAGAVTAALAFGTLVGGGVAVWADGEKDAAGFVSTDDHHFGSGGSALSSGNLDMNLDGAQWLVDHDQFGRVRLEVDSNRSKDVFVGIARTSDVDRYLDGVSHSIVEDVRSGPFRDFDATYDHESGDRRPMPPGNSRIWVASAEGAGTQSLTWDIEDGNWSVVVMNADGSPGVDADISAGAKLPWLDELAWSLLGSGTLLGIGATALLIVGLRGPKNPDGARVTASPAPAAA